MNTMLMMTTQEEGYDGAATGTLTYRHGEVIEPTLLFTVGAQAAALISAAVAQGGTWLGASPPVWRLDFPLQKGVSVEQTETAMAGLRQQLNTLCATVAAERGYSDRSHHTGGLNGRATPLSLWVAVDLTGDGKDQGHAVGARRSDRPSELALQLLQMMDVVAWQRLQLAIRPQVLLVAKAGDQRVLDECRQRLEVIAPAPYFVVGMTEDGVGAAGAPQAAETVAALLWGAPTLTSDSAHLLPAQVRYFVVGAAVWPLPTAALRQGLALWALCAALRDGQVALAEPAEKDEIATVPVTGICAWAQQLLDRGVRLADEVPAPVAVTWGRGRPRWWRKALEPTRMLLAQRQVEQGALRTAQRTARQQWLVTQLSAWEEAWRTFNNAHLTSWRMAERQAPAAVGCYADELWQLWRMMLAYVQQVDEELAALVDATTKAQTILQVCSDAVDHCCRELPTLSLVGVWQWCTQPRQWGSWLWKLAIMLPQQLQRLAKALAAYEAAVYREANTQLVRQLGLAILQDVQLQRAWLPKVRAYWQELVQRSEEALEQRLATLPAPWTPPQVRALGQKMADADKNKPAGRTALDRLLQQTAAAEWAETSVEDMVEALETVFSEENTAIEQWSVAEWLAVMFPKVAPRPGEQRDGKRQPDTQAQEAEDALWTWLDRLAEGAKPPWPQGPARHSPKAGPTSAMQGFLHFGPGRAQRPSATEEGWLILPWQFITAAADVYVADSAPVDVETWLAHQQREKRITAWLKEHPVWQRGAGPLPGIVMLRRRAIA